MRAIIFDFDGVIVDSEPVHERAIRAAMESVGLSMSHREFVEVCVGISDHQGVVRLARMQGRELTEAELEGMVGVKGRVFAELRGAGEVRPIAGTVRLIREAAGDQRLAGAVRGLAVCTGSRRAEAELQLRQAGLFKLFGAVVTRDDVVKVKPDPEPYLKACGALGREPGRCVAVEDTPTGIRSARAAGMRVVGVVAAVNVLRGLPENRTTIGTALVDTASEVTSGVGVAVSGTILAALFTGAIATSHWSVQQTAEFRESVTIAGLVLTVLAGALVAFGIVRSRRA
jgi:beta-phosphoglucomutase-like phosphatase (HAD superfamily)